MSSAMKKITIHTDGGCLGNPGPGGWAAMLEYGALKKEVSGSDPATTNNRMELTAAIEALRVLREPCEIEFFTDSQYLRQGITEWLRGWKARGWLTATKQPVKNDDLWRALDAAVAPHRITWKWLKGHAGHAGNERCDQLATAAIEAVRKRFTKAQMQEKLAEFKAREVQPISGLF